MKRVILESEPNEAKRHRFESENRWLPLPILAELNRHPKDANVRFKEEGHQYWIHNSSHKVISTTTIIKKYFQEFDPHLIIRRIMRNSNTRYWEDPTYQYYQKDADAIRAGWAELGRVAAETGTYNHEQIENYYNGLPADFSNKEHSDLFNKFHMDHIVDLEPFRTEMLMYHEELRITGSADMLYRNRKTGNLVLADWKFIKKLAKKNSSQKALAPLGHLDDTNFSKYALQLSVYRYILEEEYGYTIETQFLVILHKKQKKYRKEVTPYLKKEVEALFNLRRKEINLNTVQQLKL